MKPENLALRILDRLEEWLIVFLIGAATVLVFVSVIHRYLAGLAIPGLQDWLISLPFAWTQELTIYMFVWMAKFGAAYGVRTGIHVGVDVLINRMDARSRAGFILFGLFAGALFTFTVGTLGANFVWRLSHTIQTSPDLEAPSWLVYLCIPFGSYLMCFRFLQAAVGFIRTGELPRHDPAAVEGLDDDLHPRPTRGPGA